MRELVIQKLRQYLEGIYDNDVLEIVEDVHWHHKTGNWEEVDQWMKSQERNDIVKAHNPSNSGHTIVLNGTAFVFRDDDTATERDNRFLEMCPQLSDAVLLSLLRYVWRRW